MILLDRQVNGKPAALLLYTGAADNSLISLEAPGVCTKLDPLKATNTTGANDEYIQDREMCTATGETKRQSKGLAAPRVVYPTSGNVGISGSVGVQRGVSGASLVVSMRIGAVRCPA